MPKPRRKEGGMSARYYTRRELMNMAVEEVYNPNARWKYDTAITLSGKVYYMERAWGTVGSGKFTWWATNYTGYHKTLDVKAGQKYKVKANSTKNTSIVFCNNHVYSSRATISPTSSISIPAGTERVITVPNGYSYMMFRTTNNSSDIFTPEKIARLVAYG